MAGQHEVEAGILREANDALREENARLKAEWEMPCQRCEGYRNERDEARAANEKLRAHAGRVEQRELAALADLDEACAKLAKVVEALSGLAEAVRRLQGIEIPYPVAIPIGVKLRLAISALAAAKGE